MSTKISASDVDRLFLQALMSRRVVSEDVAKLLWQSARDTVEELNQGIETDANWNTFLGRIKGKLEPLNLDIKNAQDEETGETVMAFTNLVDDAVAQHGTDYTAAEIAYFKQVMEHILTAPNESYSIRSTEAVNLVSQLRSDQKLTRNHAEELLSSFVARGWLSQSTRGRYSVGTRSMIELHSYIENNCDEEDLVKCHICDDVVFKGYQCRGDNGKCAVRIHKPCYNKWKTRSGGGGSCVCMDCRQPWPTTGSFKLIGEDAVRDGFEPRRRPRARGSDDEEEAPSQKPSQKPPKKKTKQRRGGRAASPEEEEAEEPESEEIDVNDEMEEDEDD
ncbi:hypothetical protein FRC02_004509 [Tulasnella sp. 418]|nr:hypothetical protein FRC02_004509 [Tulasnella sp. 418]